MKTSPFFLTRSLLSATLCVAVLIAFSACNKSYTCKCESGGNEIDIFTTKSRSKSKAQRSCDDNEGKFAMYQPVDCKLE